MDPTRNLLRRHYDSYGGGNCFDEVNAAHYSKQSPHLIRSNLMMMAEHHHTPTTTTGGGGGGGGQEQDETTAQDQESEQDHDVGTSSKPPPAAPDGSWLKLGIGVSASSSSSSSIPPSFTPTAEVPVTCGPSTVELQLFSDKPSSSSSPSTLSLFRPSTVTMFSPSAPFQLGYRLPPWGFWNPGGGVGSSSNTSSSQQSPMSMKVMPQFYNVQRFPLLSPGPAGVEGGLHFGGGGGEGRVASQPVRRQQATGVWFVLKAADNQ